MSIQGQKIDLRKYEQRTEKDKLIITLLPTDKLRRGIVTITIENPESLLNGKMS